ncbi:hypothetical protein PR048_030649 [Dryococelus australis]|uniref:Uncharacterized protein n=1 Tax=Dryococelus australis TaxID=614101 RepID=A0ABQ9GAA7_9NEOP|nr:hypothetical protein PR048_030649 [Dryococelus australis]
MLEAVASMQCHPSEISVGEVQVSVVIEQATCCDHIADHEVEHFENKIADVNKIATGNKMADKNDRAKCDTIQDGGQRSRASTFKMADRIDRAGVLRSDTHTGKESERGKEEETREGPMVEKRKSRERTFPFANPLNTLVYSQQQALVYATPVDDVGTLRNRIEAGCEIIGKFPGIRQLIRVSMQRRVDACDKTKHVVHGGDPFLRFDSGRVKVLGTDYKRLFQCGGDGFEITMAHLILAAHRSSFEGAIPIAGDAVSLQRSSCHARPDSLSTDRF